METESEFRRSIRAHSSNHPLTHRKHARVAVPYAVGHRLASEGAKLAGRWCHFFGKSRFMGRPSPDPRSSTCPRNGSRAAGSTQRTSALCGSLDSFQLEDIDYVNPVSGVEALKPRKLANFKLLGLYKRYALRQRPINFIGFPNSPAQTLACY